MRRKGMLFVLFIIGTYSTVTLWYRVETYWIKNLKITGIISQIFRRVVETSSEVEPVPNTTILWYIRPRHVNDTPSLEPLTECDVPNCYITTNKFFMNISDVVIFNAQLINNPIPPKRVSSDQIWIFHNQEPTTSWWINNIKFRNKAWRGLFNWTMWYRTDADLFAPTGYILKKKTVEAKNWTDIVKRKENKAAWMVSNFAFTPSRRYEYVKLLMKYIDVDIYGEMSKNKWPRGKTPEFVQMVGTKYKFYLSFENAFCEDYISAKLVLYYQSDVIPIVRGAGNYSEFAPDNTYINTADYKSVEALGKYLQYLMKNDTAYIEILKRKHPYTSIIKGYKTAVNNKITYVHWLYEVKAMCELCKRAKNIDKNRKSIKRIDHWFDHKKCWSPTDIH